MPSSRFRAALAAAGAAVALAGVAPAGAAAPHPLDPLSAAEIARTVELLRAAGHVTAATRFPAIGLLEPPKAEVLRAEAGGPAPARKAEAVLREGTEVSEATVDLAAGKVERVEPVPGAQSAILAEEWAAAQEAALGDPRFAAALAARGVADPSKVFCAPFSMGYFAIPEHEGKRLLKVGCFDVRRSTTNVFGWPIEGLYAVVDLGAKAVTEVRDSGPVPISPADLNFDAAAAGAQREPLKPVTVASPDGPNLAVSGHAVDWQKWKLHVRLDRRVGLVLSTVSYDDRSVLYQGYLSEMFVPYMDPDYGWYSRTYFDTGEYGAGMLASALRPGIDCPETATFMAATINDDAGQAIEMPNVVCVFERNTGDPAWRHAELLNGTYEGRPGVELVVRFVPTIGNYDYLVDWVFDQRGEIEARVGATGIDALKGVASTSMADASAAADTAYGTLVAPNLVAAYHDHYFSFRLDMDVDGPANTLVRDAYARERLEGGPRRSIYRVTTEPVTAAQGLEFGHGVAKWRVTNPARRNHVGNPTSYELVHHAHSTLLLDPEDWPAKRGAFASRHLWVTPHDPAQRFAGGDYVFGAKGEDGVATWATGQDVEGEDLVLWVTMAMNHLTRSEDVPVMPTTWHSFRLRPFNFHDRNPALDVPAAFAGAPAEASPGRRAAAE